MNIFLLVAIGIISALLVVWKWITKINSVSTKFPPGPRIWFPILGHLPLLGKYPYKTFLDWKGTYGPVVGLWFGNSRAIAISDPALIKEALSLSAFAGRAQIEFLREWGGGSYKGIAASEGLPCMDQRKFTMKQLRAFGMGTGAMESKIQEQVLELVERIKPMVGRAFELHSLFELPFAKVIWSVLMSAPSKRHDEELSDALKCLTGLSTENNIAAGVSTFLPWLASLAPSLTGMTTLRNRLQFIRDFLQKRIDEHISLRPEESSSSSSSTPRDFTDAYMDKVSKTTDPASSFHPSHNYMVHSFQDVLAGGTETMSATMNWMLAYMVLWPDIQSKLYKEISTVIGEGRHPSLKDRPLMPYTVALISETLRYSSVFPLSVFHRAMEDTTFHGYHIPKDTLVFPNLYAAHFDKELWCDPLAFRPERFLKDDEDEPGSRVVINREHIMSFSSGKRACLGESLAWDELFLFTTHLFQVFEVRGSGDLPCLDGVFGATLAAQPFSVVFTLR